MEAKETLPRVLLKINHTTATFSRFLGVRPHVTQFFLLLPYIVE